MTNTKLAWGVKTNAGGILQVAWRTRAEAKDCRIDDERVVRVEIRDAAIAKKERELLRAVHANFISTEHQPPKGLSRREWLEKAAIDLWLNPETKKVRK